ncbi:CbtB domain-containing protein [Nonomuraea africana]|uniref:Cobalt transporter subunit CbtB n=1 Tax=Nonomuraea africana TaxID=46171 RepID=A0ABR9KVK5_9ACTN|nr:CbtB domain-containing protein [Nonomuraea africana]MBE1566064.1 cobalt transporter subunit CbtB [Nonomuraea africana]
MAQAAVPVPQSGSLRIPLREILPWAVFAGVLAVLLLYFVGVEHSRFVHEFVHDGRHLLGIPCH